MDVATVLEKAGAVGAGRVFSEPIERDGMTVVLAAKVGGGGGGGEGLQDAKENGRGNQSGSGLGYGYGAKPLGAFVIRAGSVQWRPAIDANRVILGMQLVAATAILTFRAIAQYRNRRAMARRFLWHAWRRRHAR